MRKFFFIFLTVLIGALFLFSAVSKIIRIEPFEWTIAETGLLSFKFSNIIARALIAFEFFIGFLFIGQILLHKFTYKAAAILLLLFNVYLLYILFAYGNSGNCGCFGDLLQMTPMQAYIKNLILLLLIYGLSFVYRGVSFKREGLALDLIAVACVLGVGIYEKPYFIYKNEKDNVKPFQLQLDGLQFANGGAFNYKQGKYVLAFFSTSCPFCKRAGRKIHAMYKYDKTIPFVQVIYGDSSSEKVKRFFEATLSNDVPYVLSKDMEMFARSTQHRLPAIFFVENGIVVQSKNYFNLDEKEIINWLK